MARKTIVVALAALTAAIGATAAFAHHVTSFTATCTNAAFSVASFSNSNKPVSYTLTSDNQPLAASPVSPWTFPGSTGALNLTYAAPLPAGDHVVKIVATWPGQGSNNGTFENAVHGCAGPVVAPPTATPPPAVPPPAAVTPPAADTPVSVATPVTVAPSRPKTKRRFGVTVTKKCVYGRKHLTDSKGRHFTMCRSKPKPPVVRVPSFTG